VAAEYALDEQIHVVRPDGVVRAGGGALLEILDALPGGPLLRPWALLPGVERVIEAGYHAVAERRDLLGQLLARSGRQVAVCALHDRPPRQER
jgi:hypothetical protein